MNFASAADLAVHGPYGRDRLAATRAQGRPDYPFQGRLGTPEFPAEPGRYHLYASWTCPYAHRATIVRALAGLQETVTLSYVDDDRDGRGWAFREHRGPDPVNGFTLLAEAYEATEPGYPGHISVPLLWDRTGGRVASNHYPTLTRDLGTAFAGQGLDLYPDDLGAEIDEIGASVDADLVEGVQRVAAARDQGEYEAARAQVTASLDDLDAHLEKHTFLTGDRLTEADVRLWAFLARYDASHNPRAGVGESPLSAFPALWSYARALYQRPAFRETTDFEALTRNADPLDTPGVTRVRPEPFAADWSG